MKPSVSLVDFEFNLFFVKPSGPTEIAWYKWEFLRRNEAYRADYLSFLDKFGGWFELKGFWYDTDRRSFWTVADRRAFKTRITPVIVRLCQRWKIGNLFPPEWEFDQETGLREVGKRNVFLPTGTPYDDLNWNPAIKKSIDQLGFRGSGESALHYRHLLLVEFNLNWPLADMLKQAETMLTLAKANWAAKRGSGKATRRRIEDYGLHLRIWDLRSKGNSIPDIAQAMFPHEDPANRRQKVRDHLKSAKKLIDGQYAEIS